MDHILKCHEIFKTDFVRGQNCHLYDSEGRKYVDFESGIWCTALGHNHPRINQVIETQLKHIAHLGTRYPNVLAEEAALAVLEAVGIEDGKCTFLSSGSEAVEFGVQVIRRVTGKPLLLTFQNSYLAGYGSAGQKRLDEWYLFDWNVSDCLDEIPFEKIGGFVFEPGGSGIGFVRFPPKQLVEEIARRVKQAGGLVAANEITTGMGRTGKWFGFQHYDIQPDIVSLGKGLGNGYPVSAVAMWRDVAQKAGAGWVSLCPVASERPAGLFHCQGSHRHFSRRGLGGKRECQRTIFSGRIETTSEETRDRKRRAWSRHGACPGAPPAADFSAASAYHILLEKGFLVGYYPAGNILRFDPALTIAEEDITYLLECLDVMLASAD